ncbi:rhomboid family intramembrane serine protease [Sphingomonas sp. Leaf4]|uniref:rhomboid family intramembrane serine protease n=1 Tax=Sphingomonas sp. Leaf4 TaxID=2876553 RepID=UPI001E32F3A1|nr:rhomboid family intramembrane serine protease [Sphingomonas sp. Leaf4]
MFERRPTRTVWTIVAIVALAGALLIVTGRIDWAAVIGGFIPARIGIDPALVAGLPLAPVWITPLSATLIHDGWAHLGFNLFSVLVVATPTQRAVGTRGLVVLWLVGAYAAAAAQWAVDPGSTVPAIGASGAISALIGAYALLFGQGKAKAIGPVPAHVVHALWLGAGWTMLNLLIGWASAQGGAPIGWAAHIGGFVAGMVLLRPLLKWRWRARDVVGG